jgi:hypothetical protein
MVDVAGRELTSARRGSRRGRSPTLTSVNVPGGCINSVSRCGGFIFVDQAAEQVASAYRRGHGVASRRSHPERVGRL